MASGWAVMLDNIYISCGEEPPECLGPEVRSLGFLTEPPEGLGVPELRTEDITYPQRDGVKMFADWYEPRQITVVVSVTEADVPCGEDGTPCTTVREAVAAIMHAWSRHCDNTELVVFTDCTGRGEVLPVATTKNLFTNPSGEVSTLGWTAINGGNEPEQLIVPDAPAGSTIIQVGSPDGSTDVPAQIDLVPMMPVPGVYTLSVTGLRGAPGEYRPGIEISGSGVPQEQSAFVDTSPGQWSDLALTYTWDGTGEAFLYPRVQEGVGPAPLPPELVGVNYETNPSFEVDATGWNSNNGSTPPAVSTERAWVGEQSVYCTRGPGTATAYANHLINNMLPGAGDYTVLARAWVPSEFNTGQTHLVRVGGAGVIGPTGQFVDVEIDTFDEWVPILIPFGFDPANGGAYIYPRSSMAQAETGMWIDGVRIAPGEITEIDYFDGDTPDTAEFDYRWTGTPHASSSEQWTTGDPGIGYTIDLDGIILTQGNDPVRYFDGDTPDESNVVYSWDGAPGESASTKTTYTIDNALVGPYGVIGRPRKAELTWAATSGYAADITLRFDAVDQNMYVLDECGNPDSGYKTIELGPGTSSSCLQFPVCFGDPVMETLSFSWEARSYVQDGIGYVEIWVTDGTFPEGEYAHSGTGFPLTWDGVPDPPTGPTWDSIDPSITWDSLRGPFVSNPNIHYPETIAPPAWMLRGGAETTAGAPFTWVVLGPWDTIINAAGTGSTTGTPEAPQVVDSGTVTYERPTGDTTGGGLACFDEETGDDGQDATAVVSGTECVSPIIELCGKLTNPTIENLTTGQSLRYRGTIRAEDPCVIIDTTDGTATQGGQSRTNLLTGDTRMSLQPGDNEFRLISFSTTDDGYARIEWRDAMIYA